MRPTFMGFETAKSAIFTNQKSLDIVGNNLSNVDTNGYTRQRVDRAAVAQSSFSTRIASNRTGLAGQGVEALGVSQTRDAFLDKCFRDEYAMASYHGQAADILSSIQNVLVDGKDITSASGIQGAIEQIYKSLNEYIKEPTLDSGANIVMSAFKNMCQVINQLDEKLTVVARQQKEDLQVNVGRTNDILEQLAHLNQKISEDATVLANPDNEYFRSNELLDQRNLLLDELAGYGDIQVTALSNGAVNVKMGGHEVVREGECNTLAMEENAQGLVTVRWRSTGEPIRLTGGTLLASQQYINGRGNNVQSSEEAVQQGIPYYRDRLDTFADALATIANRTIPVLDPATNRPMVDAKGETVYKTLLAARSEAGQPASVKAGNLSLSTEWTQGGAGYFIYHKKEDVEDYAQKLASALVDDAHAFRSYGEAFSGSFAEYTVEFLGKLGADLKFQQGRQKATAAVADDYIDQRDDVSGVSKDEETADMLKYQKSYEAAARLMTVLDEVLDVLINRMGRVGL